MIIAVDPELQRPIRQGPKSRQEQGAHAAAPLSPSRAPSPAQHAAGFPGRCPTRPTAPARDRHTLPASLAYRANEAASGRAACSQLPQRWEVHVAGSFAA
eukprot:scaffold124137_cov33-Tisochrysis_lutea.AAC.4